MKLVVSRFFTDGFLQPSSVKATWIGSERLPWQPAAPTRRRERLGDRHRDNRCHDVEEKCDEDGEDVGRVRVARVSISFSPSRLFWSPAATYLLIADKPLVGDTWLGPEARALGATVDGSWPVNSDVSCWCRRLPRAPPGHFALVALPTPAAVAGRRSISSGPGAFGTLSFGQI